MRGVVVLAIAQFISVQVLLGKVAKAIGRYFIQLKVWYL